MTGLWHDDIRRPPKGDWLWARTNGEAKEILRDREIEVADLDHDMGLHELDPDMPDAFLLRGTGEETGYDLVCWMVEHDLVPPVVRIHSYSPPGARRMALALMRTDARVVIEPYDPIGDRHA